MSRIVRRRTASGVRFCDSCAEVSTSEQRAQRRYERGHASALSRRLPR